MTRYVISILLAVAVALLLLFFKAVTAQITESDPNVHLMFGAIDWAIIFGLVLLAVLSIWGIIGIALSNSKEQAGELALQDVVISKKSWHYRLSTRLNFGADLSSVRSECEYWARFFHGLYALPPFIIFVCIVSAIVLIVGWLFGARPNVPGFSVSKFLLDGPNFKPDRQFAGPAVLGLLVVSGIVALLVFTGFAAFIASFPWVTIGTVTGIVVGGAASLVAVFFLGKMALQPLFSYAGARMRGICRPVKFVD